MQSRFQVPLAHEAATRRLAMDLAVSLGPNDLITLAGDLGAGKSTLARAIIRSLADNERMEVPSPTYTLIQIYDLPRFSVVHADLYRVKGPEELEDLGWEEAAEGALLMVEWPDCLGPMLGGDRLEIEMEMATAQGPSARLVTLTGHGRWAMRLERMMMMRAFLDNAGWGGSQRRHLQGDASSRSYERLLDGQRRAVLMNAPPPFHGPVLRQGRTYRQMAKLAEDMVPFVALAEGLRDIGLSTPEIEAIDLDQGFLILEDLGSEPVVRAGGPIPEYYGVAVEVLAEIHARPRPATLNTPKGPYTIPPYDKDAMAVEVELLLEWYIPMKGGRIPASERITFMKAWEPLFAELEGEPATWMLRDYHSPNLLWLSGREGLERMGILDFQDCLMGPAAYDVASLLQDARVDVPEDMELRLLGLYANLRRKNNRDFDMSAFARTYAIVGAQRACKILGGFARLHQRDGKSFYLPHIPRVHNYLERCLAHPALKDIKAWVDHRVPKP